MDGLLRFKPLNQTGNEIPVGVGLLITERHPHRILTVVENGSAAACGAHLHMCLSQACQKYVVCVNASISIFLRVWITMFVSVRLE